MYPHVENTIMGKSNIPHFQFGGLGAGTEAGVQAVFFRHFYLEYTNKKKTIAVGVGVRLLDATTYQADTMAILSYFRQRHAEDIASSDSQKLAELSYNGFKIYGSRANTIDLDEKYKFLGAYVLFPQKDMAVFIYFNNLGSKAKPYKDLTDLHSKISEFLGDYTNQIKKCAGK